MIHRLTAALIRLAALSGLLVVPSMAFAQLQCEAPETDIQIRSVSFEGNQTFGDKELALHVVSTPTDFTRQLLAGRYLLFGAGGGAILGGVIAKDVPGAGWGAGIGGVLGLLAQRKGVGTARCLRRGLLTGDILNLRSFYADQGFPRTQVDTATTIDGRWADLRFRIREGEPVLVDSLAITGIGSLNLGDDLRERLKSQKGARYSSTLLQADIDTIETRLRNTGRPLGLVLKNVNFSDVNNTRASVVLDVKPGPLARVGTIRINDRSVDSSRATVVDERVIRDLLRFSEGDVYSERAVFESERRFYRVGAFLGAEILPDTARVHAEGLIDVQVNVIEDLTHNFSVEPGFGTLDCLRSRVEYSDKAFLHGLNRLDITGSISKIGWANPWPMVHQLCGLQLDESDFSSLKVNYNTTVRITRPTPLRGGLLPSVSAYTERRGAYQAYLRTTLIGGAFSLSKSLTRTISGDLSYNLEYGHTDAAESVLCFLFRACDATSREQLTGGDKRLAVLGPRLSRDVRNSVDSASRGGFLRLDGRFSNPILGSHSTLSFNKGVADGAWYHRAFGRGVMAVRLRGGIVGGGFKVISGAQLPPPQERLYAGGETSVRGFSQNELGSLIYVTDDAVDTTAVLAASPSVRDSILHSLRMRTIPTGGNRMYVGNLEYRIPGPFLSSIQTILFLDVGRVWTGDSTALSASGEAVRLTPGIAFKYFSPVGPVQFNFGYNRYERPDGPVYLDRGVGSKLFCLSGTVSEQCQKVSAIAPPTSFWKRITFLIAFPPDF